MVELRTLYVQEHFVGKGVGTALLQAAVVSAHNHGGEGLCLTVNALNTRTIEFYHRRAYTRVGRDVAVVGDSQHENYVLMSPSA